MEMIIVIIVIIKKYLEEREKYHYLNALHKSSIL